MKPILARVFHNKYAFSFRIQNYLSHNDTTKNALRKIMMLVLKHFEADKSNFVILTKNTVKNLLRGAGGNPALIGGMACEIFCRSFGPATNVQFLIDMREVNSHSSGTDI